MKKQNDLLVVVLEETAWQSFISDVVTVGAFAFLIGIGVFFDSKLMEFAGFLLGIMFAIVQINSITGKQDRMTPDEAIVYIGDVMTKRGEK